MTALRDAIDYHHARLGQARARRDPAPGADRDRGLRRGSRRRQPHALLRRATCTRCRARCAWSSCTRRRWSPRKWSASRSALQVNDTVGRPRRSLRRADARHGAAARLPGAPAERPQGHPDRAAAAAQRAARRARRNGPERKRAVLARPASGRCRRTCRRRCRAAADAQREAAPALAACARRWLPGPKTARRPMPARSPKRDRRACCDSAEHEAARRMLWVASSVADALRDGALPSTPALRQAFASVERESAPHVRRTTASARRAPKPPLEPTRQLLYHVAHIDGRASRRCDELARRPSTSTRSCRAKPNSRTRAAASAAATARCSTPCRPRSRKTCCASRTRSTCTCAPARPTSPTCSRRSKRWAASPTRSACWASACRATSCCSSATRCTRSSRATARPTKARCSTSPARCSTSTPRSTTRSRAWAGRRRRTADDDLLAERIAQGARRPGARSDRQLRRRAPGLRRLRRNQLGPRAAGRSAAPARRSRRRAAHARTAAAGRLPRRRRAATPRPNCSRRKRVPNGQQLDTLADALASLEYYLEALREQPPEPRRDPRHRAPEPGSAAATGRCRPRTSRRRRVAEAGRRRQRRRRADRRRHRPSRRRADRQPTLERRAADRVAAEPTPRRRPASAAVAASPAPVAPAGVAAGGFEATSDEIDDEIREVFLEEFEEEIGNLDAACCPPGAPHPKTCERCARSAACSTR